MTYRRTISCDTSGCLALFLAVPQLGLDAVAFAGRRAGWDVGQLAPAVCPACRTGKGPVLERGECPRCLGRQRDLAEVAECMYCGHQEPHPADPFGDDDQAPADRCPAAHPLDTDPCDGPVSVAVVDREQAGTRGCERHAARILATLEGAHPYALEDAPEGAAQRVFLASADLAPLPGGKAGTLGDLADRG